MKKEIKVIDDFSFEEVCLLATFMRCDVKERLLVQLDEMQFDDEEIGVLRDSIKEKIKTLSKEELNELLFDLPPNEFSNSIDESEMIDVLD